MIAAGAGEHDGEADGGEHKEDGRPGGELGEEVGCAARAEGGLRSLAAKGSGEVGGLALLDQDDADKEEADDDVEGDDEVDHSGGFVDLWAAIAAGMIGGRGQVRLGLAAAARSRPECITGVGGAQPGDLAGSDLCGAAARPGRLWERICALELLLESELHGDQNQEHGKATPEDDGGEMLGPESAEPAADGEAHGDQHGKLDVDLTGLVVAPKGEDADGQKEGSDGGSLGLDLGHAIEVDQCRDKGDATADSDETGEDADEDAEQEAAADGHGGHLENLRGQIEGMRCDGEIMR